MNSKTLSQIKNKLKTLLKNKEILDIILFGSVVKGKSKPNDLDIALITDKEITQKIKDFHTSLISPREIFSKNPPSIINTLLREGYSLKHNKPLAETLKFNNKILFTYTLTNLSPSSKVKAVNILKGKGKDIGLVIEQGGEWLVNQAFLSPIESSNIFEKLFTNFNIKFKKSYVLLH
jgi:predicted nucleotidyltransferase